MIAFPNAKINLGLQITEKLENGYHAITSCFFPIPWREIIECLEADHTSFESSGIHIPGTPEQNLILKAYELLASDFQLPPQKLILHKMIPIGAGLGGGSADASFMLKMLNEEYELTLSTEQLENYAAQLGSDCPFFICNQAAIATGTGTTLKPIQFDLKGFYMLVINPGIHISTKEAYAGVKPKSPTTDLESLVLSKDFSSWRNFLVNDFEASLFPSYPQIQKLKEELYEMGALYASMTGSGSTLYGIFDKEITIPTSWSSFQSRFFSL